MRFIRVLTNTTEQVFSQFATMILSSSSSCSALWLWFFGSLVCLALLWICYVYIYALYNGSFGQCVVCMSSSVVPHPLARATAAIPQQIPLPQAYSFCRRRQLIQPIKQQSTHTNEIPAYVWQRQSEQKTHQQQTNTKGRAKKNTELITWDQPNSKCTIRNAKHTHKQHTRLSVHTHIGSVWKRLIKTEGTHEANVCTHRENERERATEKRRQQLAAYNGALLDARVWETARKSHSVF